MDGGKRAFGAIVAFGAVVTFVGAVAAFVGALNGAWTTRARATTDASDAVKVAVASTMSASAPTMEIAQWKTYHRKIGVYRFYLFFDGDDDGRSRCGARRREKDVTCFDKRTSTAHFTKSPLLGHPSLGPYVTSRCGARALFVRQTVNLELALEAARVDGVDWLIHIDADELIYPANGESPRSARTNTFDVRYVLANLPRNVTRVVFPNYEAVPEHLVLHSNASSLFRSTTLFKRNHLHVDKEVYAKYRTIASNGNANYFLAYANGKSAVRVASKGVRPHGAHRFMTALGREIVLDEGAILHFAFVDLERARRRIHRCDCPDSEFRNCSMLDFDIELRQRAALGARDFEEFFGQRVVVNSELTRRLLKVGIFTRIFSPSLLFLGVKN